MFQTGSRRFSLIGFDVAYPLACLDRCFGWIWLDWGELSGDDRGSLIFFVGGGQHSTVPHHDPLTRKF